MKLTRWIGLLLFVFLASYYYHSRKVESPAPVSIPVSEPGSIQLRASATPAMLPEVRSVEIKSEVLPVKSVSNPVPVPERLVSKPKDLMVHFEMKDGYAVAYGDTILGKPLKDFHESRGVTEIKPPQYWPHGEVPYQIKDDVVNPERVKDAIALFNSKTNVKFVEWSGQPDAVVFAKGNMNCASFLGRMGGVQPIFLSEKCGTVEISHEIMHALGFVHEQSRVDRDQYIDILWPNIEQPYWEQFAMVPEPLMDPFFDSPFNSTSIMMYEAHLFAASPTLETMKTKDGKSIVPPSRSLSEVDIARVNRLYPR